MNEQDGHDGQYEETFAEADAGYDEPITALEREPLPAPLPAVREWFALPLGIAGLGCLAGAGTHAATVLGYADHPMIERATSTLNSVGGTPAILAIGGAALVGLAAGAFGRMRQTKRTLATLAQNPDYGSWLEDLDEGLQRMHVSLVTVESHTARAIDGSRVDVARRIENAANNDVARTQALEQEIGGRLMRLESSVASLSAVLQRLEERSGDEPEAGAVDSSAIEPLVERLEQALGALDRAGAPEQVSELEQDTTRTEDGASAVDAETDAIGRAEAHEGNGSFEATSANEEPETVEATDVAETPVAAAQIDSAIVHRDLVTQDAIGTEVDEPAAAMPTTDEEADCPVEGLPLFAAVEDRPRSATPAVEPVEPPPRNPYDL